MGAMRSIGLALLILCGWGAGTSRAGIITIDGFGAPDPADVYLISVNHPNATPIEDGGLTGAIGSERDTLVEVLGEPSVQSASVLIGFESELFDEGILQVATAREPATVITLQYDGDDVDGDSLVNSRGLNVDLTDGGVNTRLVIDFLSVDAPGAPGLDLDIRLTSRTGGSALFQSVVPESAVPSSFSALFSEFVPQGDFSLAEVDSIEVGMNGAALADVDFEIDRFFAIPEPNALALLVVGICAAWPFIRRSVANMR